MVLATTNTDVHAAIPNPIFYYHVGDHLGSSNLVTDRNGALVQHREYWAFGQQRVRSESAQDYVFNRYTGQIFDDETGLYYYGARYYDPELGRFIQPDTMVPDPSDSQQLNRYSYVNNNPLKYTDPTGHIAEWVIAAAVYILVSAAVGAAVGAATAAATGGDIGKGAVGGALSGAFSIIPYVGTVVGAVVTAAIYGDDIGRAALYASIGSVIGFAVGGVVNQVPGLDNWYGDLIKLGVATGAGALAGGITAEAMGGEFSEGATTGAISAAISHTIYHDAPSAYRNAMSENPRFHLFIGLVIIVAVFLYATTNYANAPTRGDEIYYKTELPYEDAADLVNPPKMAVGLGKQLAKQGIKAGAGAAATERAKNIAKGVAENQIGPSGKPKIHVVKHSTMKEAKDAARAEVGKGGTTVKHPSPAKGGPHFHGETQAGQKSRIHHEYPD
jgi:RHS repeat-associated protein